jgi:hypothetical protein
VRNTKGSVGIMLAYKQCESGDFNQYKDWATGVLLAAGESIDAEVKGRSLKLAIYLQLESRLRVSRASLLLQDKQNHILIPYLGFWPRFVLQRIPH